MTIYNMAAIPRSDGSVELVCNECRVPAEDAQSDQLLKICPRCGAALGEWPTELEMQTEIGEFTARLRHRVE